MGIVTENNLNCKVGSCFLGKHTWALSTEGLTLHWKCVTPYQELSHLPRESFTTFWNSSVSVFPQDNTNRQSSHLQYRDCFRLEFKVTTAFLWLTLNSKYLAVLWYMRVTNDFTWPNKVFYKLMSTQSLSSYQAHIVSFVFPSTTQLFCCGGSTKQDSIWRRIQRLQLPC